MGRNTSLIRKRIEKAFYSPRDFLVVEDEKRPSTWRIRIAQNGIPSERLMRNAYAYLTKGFAGRTYKGPQKEQAMSKLRSMFRAMNKPVPGGKQAEARPTQAAEVSLADTADFVLNTDKPIDEFGEGVGYMYMDGEVPSVPWGVTSFGDLLAADEAKEHANEVMVLAYQLTRLVENIVNSSDLPDKLGALTNLVNEFVTLAGEAMTPAMPEAQPLNRPAEESARPAQSGDQLAESFGGLLELSEAEAPVSGVPLTMRVGIIKPGWGNERDAHYYPAEVLRRDAKVFEGAKMYETDHKESERSTRTWVSTIDSIESFAADGSPVARVIVHDPNFAERVRALKAAGKLDKLECSILATGRAKPGQVDGKSANVVEAITEAHAVDWVTRAGAGGRALDLAESADGAQPEQEEQKPFTAPTQPAEPQPATFDSDAAAPTEPVDAEKPSEPVADPTTKPVDGETPAAPAADGAAETQLADGETKATEAAAAPVVTLSEAQVMDELARTRLPAVSRDRLARQPFASVAELGAAIDAEIAYVKELTGSGRPFLQSGAPAPAQPVVTAETAQKTVAEINKTYFGR